MSNVVSKFLKVDKNVLIEYKYNKDNIIIEPYNILVNSRDRIQSYVSADTTITGNSKQNQLFRIDAVQNKFSKVDTEFYSFLQLKNFGSSTPIRHDRITVHLPINWTFGEYLGFYIKVYTFDSGNRNQVELSNFYFDMSDFDQQSLLNFTSPPLLFQEKLWGKNISIDIPAVSEVSSQLTNNRPTDNSLNFNLTNGTGLSLNSPIFIDFHFINGVQVINGISNYILSSPVTTTVSQTPDFERLGLKIENSKNGDFFEIYGTFNGTISEFKKFIDDSVSLGNRYFVQYNITLFEQNIRGKTITVNVTSDFNESIEYRPIIKRSTTTAIIDVEMRLIDAVDDSYIIRRASYGMLQDEVSKYSVNLTKINLKNAFKPKIYNIKNAINPDLVGVANSMGMIGINNNPKQPMINRTLNNALINGNGTVVEQVKVPFPVLVEKFNVIAKSDNAVLDSKTFFGFGKIQILLYPFDNVVKFSIATGSEDNPKYLDLTGYSEIKFVIKNDSNTISFTPFIESGEIDLVNGGLAFKITEAKFPEIKRIHNSGINVFYITGKNLSTTSVIYTGLFKIFDDPVNINELNEVASEAEIEVEPTPERPTAIVTRRPIEEVGSFKQRKSPKDLLANATFTTTTPTSQRGLFTRQERNFESTIPEDQVTRPVTQEPRPRPRGRR